MMGLLKKAHIRRFLYLSCFVTAAFILSCAGRAPRDPSQTYVDELKYLEKGEIRHFGIFTTRPVTDYHIDKTQKPPAVFISLESVDVEDMKLPKRYDSTLFSDIESKTAQAAGKKFGQIWFHLKKDVDYAAKVTEYGLRIDMRPTGEPLASEESVELKRTEEKDQEVIDEDIKEAEEAHPPDAPPIETSEPPVFETEKKEEPAEPKIVLERIDRETTGDKEQLKLIHSAAVDFEKNVLDREIILELKGVQTSPTIIPLMGEDPQSFISQVTTTESETPYPSTKVSILLKEAVSPQFSHQANEITLEFPRRKVSKILSEEEPKIEFRGYLAPPTEFAGRELSLHIKDTSFSDVLRLLSESSDYNFVLGEKVETPVNLRLVNVSWDKAFVTLLETYQLGYVKQGNIIRVSSLSSLKKEKVKASQALEAQEELDPLKVLFIPLQHRKAADLKPHVYPLLSKRGSLSIDWKTNTLIVRDTYDSLERVKSFVASLDITP